MTDHAPAVGELAVTGSAQLDRVIPCGRCATSTIVTDLFAALDTGDDERAAELLDQLERWVTA